MAGPTIRINDFNSYPEVTAVSDVGSTLEIGNLNDFDMGMLGNQRKKTKMNYSIYIYLSLCYLYILYIISQQTLTLTP